MAHDDRLDGGINQTYHFGQIAQIDVLYGITSPHIGMRLKRVK